MARLRSHMPINQQVHEIGSTLGDQSRGAAARKDAEALHSRASGEVMLSLATLNRVGHRSGVFELGF
jgi:hypothetical protein